MTEFVLATKNPNKTAEFREMLLPLGFKVLNAIDFPELPDVVEDGETLEENALKKARTIAQLTGKAALADDTGLLVNALNGAPGVYSARYAGEKASYQDNVKKLISELSKKGNFPFTAHFETILALVDGTQEFLFKGICKGKIIGEQRGEKGFGYDPVFMPDEFELTFAELTSEQKNAISHRGKALRKFFSWLNERMK
jgi:XTP/dITP diphosphohydrolase